MAGKERYVRNKPHMNIGTIGHVDHGKTTLTAAITKFLSERIPETVFRAYEDIDNAPDEKKLNNSINATIVNYSTETRHYAHTDCPGHANYIKNMITGTHRIECAILVVSATDGIMPQTREHLLLAKQNGIEHLVVYISKADAVDDEEILEPVQMETREVLGNYGFDGETTPIVIGSALSVLEGKDDSLGMGSIKQLLEHVDSIPIPTRDIDKALFLPIEQVFSITGRGIVATGRIEHGSIKVGEEVEIIGYNKLLESTVTGVEMSRKLLEKGQAGDQVGVLLPGLKRGDIRRGMAVIKPKTMAMNNYFSAQVSILSTDKGGRMKPTKEGHQVHVFSKSWDCPAFVVVDGDKKVLMPGEDASVKLHLQKKMVTEVGQRFIFRDGRVTAGYGVISEILPDPGLGKWAK